MSKPLTMFLPPSHAWLRLPLNKLRDIVGANVEVRIQRPPGVESEVHLPALQFNEKAWAEYTAYVKAQENAYLQGDYAQIGTKLASEWGE